MATNNCERYLNKSDLTNVDLGTYRFPFSSVLLYPTVPIPRNKMNNNKKNVCKQRNNCAYRDQQQQPQQQVNCMNSQSQNKTKKKKTKCCSIKEKLYNNLLKFPLTKGLFCVERETTNECSETSQEKQTKKCQTPVATNYATNNVERAACSSQSIKPQTSTPKCTNANCPYRKQLEILLKKQNCTNINEARENNTKMNNNNNNNNNKRPIHDTSATCKAFDINFHQFPLTKGWLFPTVRGSEILITTKPERQNTSPCLNAVSQQTTLCAMESDEEIDETEFNYSSCHKAMEQKSNAEKKTNFCAHSPNADVYLQPSVDEYCMSRLKRMDSQVSTLCGHCSNINNAQKAKSPKQNIKKKSSNYCYNHCASYPSKPKRKIVRIQPNKNQNNNNCQCQMCRNQARTAGGCNFKNQTYNYCAIKPKINTPNRWLPKTKVYQTNATCNSVRQKSGAETQSSFTKPNANLQHLKKRQKFENVSKEVFHKLFSRFQGITERSTASKTVNVNPPTAATFNTTTATNPYLRKRLPSVENLRFQDAIHNIPAPGWEPKRIVRILSPPKTITSCRKRKNKYN